MTNRIAMLRLASVTLALALCAVTCAGTPARADLQICNRMSYVVETALGIETGGAAATRGWFRIDPGQCRTAIEGEVQVEGVFVHVRALAVYGGSPLPQAGHTDFCVANETFALAQARHCTRPNHRLARFTQVRPAENEKGVLSVYLAEDAEYTDDQARDAGIQRLLVIAGYDATPIDGIRGAKTDQALVQFLQDNKLGLAAAGRPDFFDTLIAVAQRPEGPGFAWCNDTPHPVLAALGVEERGAVTTRGWYRVEPGKCLRPDVKGKPQRLYSFGEAVGKDGQPLRDGRKTLAWGGETVLCTRNVKFELSEHKDCAGNGLTSSGFATVDLSGKSGTVVRFQP